MKSYSKRHNMSHKGKLTKYQRTKQNKELLILFSIWIVSIPIIMFFQSKNNFSVDGTLVETSKTDTEMFVIDRRRAEGMVVSLHSDVSSVQELSSKELNSKKEIREITMYNAGDPNQCDSTPCISASGDNICNLLAKGVKICAANFVPLGTKLEIQNYGECVVLDRMNSRFKNRVDIAAEAHEKPRAIKFGLQHLAVKIIK